MHIELEHITKRFGALCANNAISMTLEGGQIYAVLGENGAGKSTLMKILSGYQPADTGRIVIDQQPIAFNSPADALAHGIGMLHQDPLDVPTLSVLDNCILGLPGGLLPDRRTARAALIKTAAHLGFSLRPDAFIDSLTIAERQQVEIVRLLSQNARVLILDEPTTGISEVQKDTLFRSLKQLAHDDGLIVILVSHKLEDVEKLCDQVYVLRTGQIVGQERMPCPVVHLITLMFGQHLEPTTRIAAAHGEVILSVRNLQVKDERLTLDALTLDVRAGEVIGLAGLNGSGQQAFLRACAGLYPTLQGQILLENRDITPLSYHERLHCGISYASAGRLEEGLTAGLTVAEHFALVAPKGARVDWAQADQAAQAAIAHYKIKAQPTSPIETLSGGNQQRVLLALLPNPLKLLLLESPTRGLDVESARWVWSQLLERRAQGTALIFLSAELDEIVAYSDRIGVFSNGRMTLIDDPAHTSIEQLGTLIGGKTA